MKTDEMIERIARTICREQMLIVYRGDWETRVSKKVDEYWQEFNLHASMALAVIEPELERLRKEVEALRESTTIMQAIPCILESEDGNPGWGTFGDAIRLLAHARKETRKANAALEAAQSVVERLDMRRSPERPDLTVLIESLRDALVSTQ